MTLNEIKKSSKVGRSLGYFSMFLIFSIVLYLILTILDKIPDSWNYMHILAISIILVIVGKSIGGWLK